MIGIDTNVLVRVLVDDKQAASQCHKARALLRAHNKIFISTIVLTETVWVLQRAYGVDKNDTVNLLDRLLIQKAIVFENRPLLETAIDIYRKGTSGFSDALILAAHHAKACRLYTFDKKLARHESVTDLSGMAL